MNQHERTSDDALTEAELAEREETESPRCNPILRSYRRALLSGKSADARISFYMALWMRWAKGKRRPDIIIRHMHRIIEIAKREEEAIHV